MAARQPYDLDRLEKTSRRTGIATLIGALIVIGALVFSTVRLSNMQDEVNQLEARSATLDQLIEERQAQLDELGQLITDAQSELEELNDMETEMHTPEASSQAQAQAQAQVNEKSASVRQTLNKAVEAYSKIKEAIPSGDALRSKVIQIQMCKQVENLEPIDCGVTFEASTVYLWARLAVPQKETITIRLMTAAGEMVQEGTIDVERSTGYRIYYSKTFSTDDDGEYEVRLFDGAGNQIGSQRFTITP